MGSLLQHLKHSVKLSLELEGSKGSDTLRQFWLIFSLAPLKSTTTNKIKRNKSKTTLISTTCKKAGWREQGPRRKGQSTLAHSSSVESRRWPLAKLGRAEPRQLLLPPCDTQESQPSLLPIETRPKGGQIIRLLGSPRLGSSTKSAEPK